MTTYHNTYQNTVSLIQLTDFTKPDQIEVKSLTCNLFYFYAETPLLETAPLLKTMDLLSNLFKNNHTSI